MVKPFFCISYFDGDISWVESICDSNYVIYAKGPLPANAPENIIQIPNVGYNIYSYLNYIIDHYESLPKLVVFCKNNVFERHVSRKSFEAMCVRQVFTPIEEPGRWDRISFPASVVSSDGGFLELNNSWYVSRYDRRYFHNFDSYFSFIFDAGRRPDYLRFAPGANYLVPREYILLRSKNFYLNLRNFVSHAQFSCESHYVERSLIALWSSALTESKQMSEVLTDDELNALAQNCSNCVSKESRVVLRFRRGAMNFISSLSRTLFGI